MPDAESIRERFAFYRGKGVELQWLLLHAWRLTQEQAHQSRVAAIQAVGQALHIPVVMSTYQKW